MSVQINYGICVGGPFNNKHLAHATSTYRVAINRKTKKGIPAMQESTDLDIKFGTYTFDGKAWQWQEES